MPIESIRLPISNARVHVALYCQVSNARQLRQRLVSASQSGDANLRAEVDFSFIDASMLTSRVHLWTAVAHALVADAYGTLKSNTLHSEVISMLDPGSNISEALKHFGLSPTTTDLVVVRVCPSRNSNPSDDDSNDDDAVASAIASIVQGEITPLDLIGDLPDGRTNDKSLRKVYKLNGDVALSRLTPRSREYRRTLDQLVTSSVALKSVS
ncbi:hypothetical protein JCM3766R1_005972 [Sporobolomyces carnicolor]